MNKKGFTLVELIAVIAILAILIVMIAPGYMAIRKRVLENTLETKISQIENAAKNYGTEHINELKSRVSAPYNNEKTPSEDCIYRNVNFLINNGYLTVGSTYVQTSDGSKETQFINPVTGESMNNQRVCIRFSSNNAMTREIIAYLVEES